MNKKVCLALLFAAACCSFSANAEKKRTFYNEKNDIVGISGDVAKLLGGTEYMHHFFSNNVIFSTDSIKVAEIRKTKIDGKNCYVDVEKMIAELNGLKAGNAVLKYILNDNGKVSFERLQNRTLINSNQKEIEVANENQFVDPKVELRQNVGPQFAKNYIFFQQPSAFKGGKNVWVLFRANMDEATYDQVYNLLPEEGDLPISKLDELDIPVEYVASGLSKQDNEELSGYTMRDLGLMVSDFAIRGDISRKNFEGNDSKKLYANVGTLEGVEHLDRMYIFRPAVNRKGELYSHLVGAARVVKESDDKVRLYTYAGGFANSKKGDVAVLQHDKRMSTSFALGYQNKSVNFNFQFEYLLGMTPAGMGHEFFVRIGTGWFLPSESKLMEGANYVDGYLTEACVPVDMEQLAGIRGVGGINLVYDQYDNYYTRYFDSFKKPIPIRIGVGYGPTWNFAHLIELMPYVGVEMEMLLGFNRGVFTETNNKVKTDYATASFRVPLGARVAFNLNKKGNSQLFLGAEYFLLNYGLELYKGMEDKQGDGTDKGSMAILPYSWWHDGVATHNGLSRKGLHAYAGFRFNF